MFTVLRPRRLSLKRICLSVAIAALVLGVSYYFWALKTVTIVDTDSQLEIRTFASTVKELLQQEKIALGPEDIVRPNLSTPLEEGMTITIARAVPVRVEENGTVKTVYVAEPTVPKVLTLANIALTPLDVVEHNLEVQEEKDKYLKITHIEEEKIEQTFDIDFPVKRQPDQLLSQGETKVIQAGEKGLVKETIVITYVDGKETKREVVNREVIKEPKPKIIAYGTREKKVVQASRNLQGKRTLFVEATAYTHTGNRTATGIEPYHGVVAVDPKVIPLGTKLFVEGYGYGEALDIGGSIKGNRIDLFFETKAECLNWGRRDVQVYILD